MTTFNSDQLDDLRELMNLGLGSSAKAMEELLHTQIQIFIPEMYSSLKELQDATNADEKYSICEMKFTGDLSGVCTVLFPIKFVRKLLEKVSPGGNLQDNLEDKIDILIEVGNIILTGFTSTIFDITQCHTIYHQPVYTEEKFVNIWNNFKPVEEKCIFAKSDFKLIDDDCICYLLLEVGEISAMNLYEGIRKHYGVNF
ncbi:MAG: hypothetical protein H6622_04085 [Halobacteriovoraceae bacterium]|nr:hypothetical protein [Halobacteriovoraceae bacterium]